MSDPIQQVLKNQATIMVVLTRIERSLSSVDALDSRIIETVALLSDPDSDLCQAIEKGHQEEEK